MLTHRSKDSLTQYLTPGELQAFEQLQQAGKELALAQAEIDLEIPWHSRRYNIERAEQRLRDAEAAWWDASL